MKPRELGSLLATAAILFKVLAFIFINYHLFAVALHLFSIGTLSLCWLINWSIYLRDKRGLGIVLIFALIGCLSGLHAQLLLVENDRTLQVLAPVMLITLYILPIRSLDVAELNRILSLIGIATLLKIVLNVIILTFFLLGLISPTEESFEAYFGDVSSVAYESFSIFKLYEKSLLFIPLIFYGQLKSFLSVIVRHSLAWVGVLWSMTISFITGLAFFYAVLLVRLAYERRFFIVSVVFFSVFLIATLFSQEIGLLFLEKSISISIKAKQVDAFWGVRLLGAGIGSSSIPSLQPGQIFFENSYVLLVLWLGVFAIPFITLIAGSIVLGVSRVSVSYNHAVTFAALMGIFISSGSNPYLFSGSIVLVLFILMRRIALGTKNGA